MQKVGNFKNYIIAFEQRLELIVINDISIELYCKKYLSHLLLHKKYYLAMYADVLNKLVKHSPKNKESISLIDYGSGNELLGIFAKYCGFKKVFINDINAKFVNASEKLSLQLDVEIDGFIIGDISQVQTYFTKELPDAIVGTDVIEHIYDLEHFFTCQQQINQSMVAVFTTASNPKNYFKVRTLKRMQLKDELEGGYPDDHILFGETSHEPFIKIRSQIIKNYSSNLSDSTITGLAKATRGKNRQDIIEVVEQYNISGKFPLEPTHSTNTCNPLDSSWTERILSLKEYTLLCNSAGFTATFYNGFYNVFETGFKNYIKKLLNISIAIFGNKISPYILIVSFRKKDAV